MALRNTYGFGLIGCGLISDTHIEAIRRIPEARLVAVCDVVEAKARQKGEQHGAAWHTDLHELVARDDVQVVNVVTPSGLHHEAGIAAAQAGKHVICTKPIDVTLEAIDALIAACAEHGVKLAATHQFRAFPVYLRTKQALDEGRLGKPLYANAFVPWFRTQAYYDNGWHGTRRLDGGGALMNQSIHWIDLLLWMMGEAESVAGMADQLAHRMETEDYGAAVVRFKRGAYGLIQGTTCTHRGMPCRFEVHGTKGNVVTVADRLRLWDVEGEPPEEHAVAGAVTGAGDPAAGLADAVNAHVEQIRDVLLAIEEGREPILNGREARRAVELILAIYESSETGRVVRLPL
jgi:predicted dehydrogenase